MLTIPCQAVFKALAVPLAFLLHDLAGLGGEARSRRRRGLLEARSRRRRGLLEHKGHITPNQVEEAAQEFEASFSGTFTTLLGHLQDRVDSTLSLRALLPTMLSELMTVSPALHGTDKNFF